jgi:hypothetical protein
VPLSNESHPSGRVAALELIPGHATTEAEVVIWSGPVPGVTGQHGPWVVLRGDDWPMTPTVARSLAAALLQAADRVEAPPAAGDDLGDGGLR